MPGWSDSNSRQENKSIACRSASKAPRVCCPQSQRWTFIAACRLVATPRACQSSSQHTASPAFGCADNDLRRGSQWQNDRHVFLYTFDMIELYGQDLRREQIEARKAELAKLLRNLTSALRSRRRRWVHSHGER